LFFYVYIRVSKVKIASLVRYLTNRPAALVHPWTCFSPGRRRRDDLLHERNALLLSGLVDEGLVDVRDDTSSGDGGLDEGIQLLVSPNSELKMAGGDTLHLEILGGVTRQLEHLSREVLEDGGGVDGGRGSDPSVGGGASLEQTVDTSDRELESGTSRPRDGLLLVTGPLHSDGALGTLSRQTFGSCGRVGWGRVACVSLLCELRVV
jgi:hypothetical protein